MKLFGFWILVLVQIPLFTLGQKGSEKFAKIGSDFIFSDLQIGDTRKEVMQKLRDSAFIQIYEERDNGLIKSTFRLNDFRYELGAKLINNKLEFCLIDCQKGWQFSFYEDVVEPQWRNLREVLVKTYGKQREHRDFPELIKVPLNDKGGYVTDTWDTKDRLIMLTVLFFEVKDCCTNQMVEYSCCTLLIQPKKKG